MKYCNVEFVCIGNGGESRNSPGEPILVNGLIIGEDGEVPSCYREVLTLGPEIEPRSWIKISGTGEDSLPYILQEANSNVRSAILVSGDYAYEWITGLADFDIWWDNLVRPTFSVAETVAVAIINFRASKGAIAVLGKTAPSINIWITRKIQSMGRPIDNMFDATGKPLPGLKGAAGRVLQSAQSVSNWAKKLKIFAYVAVFTDGIIYGLETGDWTMTIYRIAAGAAIVAASSFLIGTTVSTLAGAGATAAATALTSAGWIAAGSALSVLGPLAAVAIAAIAVGFFVYWLDQKFDLTGKLAQATKSIVDSISAGARKFAETAAVRIGQIGNAIDKGIEEAKKVGASLLQSFLTSVDELSDNVQDAVQDTAQNIQDQGASAIKRLEDEILRLFYYDIYKILRR